MPHPAAGLRRRAPPILLLLALGVPACWGLRTDGLADGGPPVTTPDARPGDAGVSSPSLPVAGARSAAVWTCSGGGAVSKEGVRLGVTLGAVSGAGSVSAPGGARVTLGHFPDTATEEETIR
jgi:hypothetical protein